MARYVYINGIKYDESEVFTYEGVYDSYDDWWEEQEEVECEIDDRRRKDEEQFNDI